MEPLFLAGERATVGFVCQSQQIWVGVEDCPLQEMPLGAMLVGTVECFLDLENPARLFSVYIPDGAKARKTPFYKIIEQMDSYDSGYECNRFLALMIEVTNQCILSKGQALARKQKGYQLRSMVYCRILRDLADLWRDTSSLEIYALVSRHQDSPLFRDGNILERDDTIAKISVPSTPMKQFVQKFEENAFICREDEPADAMFILLNGKVAVRKGGRSIAHITKQGEAFGELSFFLEGRRTATLTAESATTLYRVRKNELPDFFKTHPGLFLNMARTLARRIERNIQRVRFMNTRLETFDAEAAEESEDYYRHPDAGKQELKKLIDEINQIKIKTNSPYVNKFVATLEKDSDLQEALR